MHEAGLFIFGHTEDAPASNRAGQDGIEHIWGYAQHLMTPMNCMDFRPASISTGECFSKTKRASIS